MHRANHYVGKGTGPFYVDWMRNQTNNLTGKRRGQRLQMVQITTQ